jgi:hypothetical protein
MRPKTRRRIYLMLQAPLFAGLAACATPPPHQAVARAESALVAAEKAGAAEDAAVSLRRSRDELGKAERSMEAESYDEARRAAEAAEVDAHHAMAQARRAEARRSFEELDEATRALQEEIRHDQR